MRSAQSWLTFRASALSIAAGGSAELRGRRARPARARPGDHHALVLLVTRPSRRRRGRSSHAARRARRRRAPGHVSSGVSRCEVCASAGALDLAVIDVTLENLGDLIETKRRGRRGLSARGRVERVHAERTRGAAGTRAILTAPTGEATRPRARDASRSAAREAELQAAAVSCSGRARAARRRSRGATAARSPPARSCSRPARRARACPRGRAGRSHAERTWARCGRRRGTAVAASGAGTSGPRAG